jgi:hypothetical protein
MPSLRLSAIMLLAAIVVVAVLVVSPFARSQPQPMPSYIPSGAAANNSGSTAWFLQPALRQVIACHQAINQPGNVPTVQCATAKLP